MELPVISPKQYLLAEKVAGIVKRNFVEQDIVEADLHFKLVSDDAFRAKWERGIVAVGGLWKQIYISEQVKYRPECFIAFVVLWAVAEVKLNSHQKSDETAIEMMSLFYPNFDYHKIELYWHIVDHHKLNSPDTPFTVQRITHIRKLLKLDH